MLESDEIRRRMALLRKVPAVERERTEREQQEAFDKAVREWLDNRTPATTDKVYTAALTVYGASVLNPEKNDA